MNTHVIILAQGNQSRLPALPMAKQLLPLPACGDQPIIYRTLRQLWHVMDGINISDGRDDRVTVVAGFSLMETLIRTTVEVPWKNAAGAREDWRFTPSTVSLPRPGNSSLKGISRFIAQEDEHRAKRWNQGISTYPEFDRYVVLLGDVVYSWACLRAIFDVDPPWCFRFVGTSDLSRSGGELWGLSWTWEADHDMRTALAAALDKHPPFEDYQPGQMRRWLWARERAVPVRSLGAYRGWWTAIDDYTRDIDIPAHLELLGDLSERARADDEANGVTW